MTEKLTLIMRDPRKAPYDVPLLVKTDEESYVVAIRSKWAACWCLADVDGSIVEVEGNELEVNTPLFYCELPK